MKSELSLPNARYDAKLHIQSTPTRYQGMTQGGGQTFGTVRVHEHRRNGTWFFRVKRDDVHLQHKAGCVDKRQTVVIMFDRHSKQRHGWRQKTNIELTDRTPVNTL
jgi:hypothetical protein